MTVAAGPNLGLISGWVPGASGWGGSMDANLRELDSLVWFTTKVAPLNTPPGSPTLGDRYIIGTAPTGAWSGHGGALTAYLQDENGTNAWAFYPAKSGWTVLVLDVSGAVAPVSYLYRGGVWAVAPGGVSLTSVNAWTAAQRGVPVALVDGASIASDFATGNNYSVTLAGNRTLANPTNVVAGQAGQIVVTQDGTGSRTLAYGSVWKFAGGVAPVLSVAPGAVDILSYYVIDPTHIAVSSALAFA